MRVFLRLSLIFMGIQWCMCQAAEPSPFEDDIVPLLKKHCIKCHGPVTQEGKLNLSRSSGLIRGGASGAAVVPHDVDGSLIWQKVSSDEMPPDKPLSNEEKSLLKQWIAAGTKGLKQDDADDRPHWAFRPLNEAITDIRAQGLPNTDVPASSVLDQFLLNDLARDELSYLPEAERYQLIRRLSFDLTGLPPSPDAIREFSASGHIDDYARLVDQMLASPHYGERLGKLWLDAAGYADSNGYFNADSDRPLAYRYRDYVIRSLNADKPFDEFLREQIAGDELSSITAKVGETVVLPESAGLDRKEADRILDLWEATHYLRNGQDGTGESDGNPDEVRIDRYTVIETTMQNISTGVLGLTIQCAKCHDHKFEPLTQKDYYAFEAVLIPAFPPEQWKKPNERFVYASPQSERDSWQRQLTETEALTARLQTEVQAWTKAHHPQGTVLFSDSFEDPPESLAVHWSHTAPGDDRPGGPVAVNLNSREAPAAVIHDGRLQIIEGGPGGDKWISTTQRFDWTPDAEGAAIQVTFDLIDHHVDQSAPAERIAYFLATHDFDNNSATVGGNVLIDGHPSQGSSVTLDYPGANARPLGTIGKTGYSPGHNYGIRVTNLGKGKFQLQHLVDRQLEDPVIKVAEADLPDGGFGFEYCCGRSFVVDNVVVETFAAGDGPGTLGGFLKELAELRKPLDEANKRQASLKSSPPGKISWTTDIVDAVPDVHVFERGNYHTPGELVAPAGFSVLAPQGATSTLPAPEPEIKQQLKSSGRRRAYAEWLTSPNSPSASLLARVHVNRIWQHVFGVGIVATPDNFGLSGSPPIHPQLLDWLASEFVRSGWSTKQILKLIVMSDAYRQRSSVRFSGALAETTNWEARRKADPDARRLSRYPVHRLDAESIRDLLLVSSGDFDDRMAGPYIPTTRTGNGETVVPEGHAGAYRRSIYLQQKRNQVHSLLQVFDAPSIVFNSTRRARSTMPLQSLSLLNSEFIVKRSSNFAESILSSSLDENARIQMAYLRTAGRMPLAADAEAATQFIGDQVREYQDSPTATLQAWADFCQILLVENASLYLD